MEESTIQEQDAIVEVKGATDFQSISKNETFQRIDGMK